MINNDYFLFTYSLKNLFLEEEEVLFGVFQKVLAVLDFISEVHKFCKRLCFVRLNSALHLKGISFVEAELCPLNSALLN